MSLLLRIKVSAKLLNVNANVVLTFLFFYFVLPGWRCNAHHKQMYMLEWLSRWNMNRPSRHWIWVSRHTLKFMMFVWCPVWTPWEVHFCKSLHPQGNLLVRFCQQSRSAECAWCNRRQPARWAGGSSGGGVSWCDDTSGHWYWFPIFISGNDGIAFW